MDYHFLLAGIRNGYYTVVLMECANILVIITYLKRKPRNTFYLFLLSLVSLIQSLVNQCADLIGYVSPGNILTNSSIYLYTLCEITLSLAYIQIFIPKKGIKKGMLASWIIFTSVTLYNFICHLDSRKIVSYIGIAEGIIIIIACLCFFYKLFKTPAIKNVSKASEIWAIAGIFLLFSLITPFFLMLDYLKNHNWLLAKKLYIINNISYCLMFIAFTIAIRHDRSVRSAHTR